jgi:hypothetical protein
MDHKFVFDHLHTDLDSATSWDELRISDPHFSIPNNREEWIRVCNSEIKKDGQDGAILDRTNTVVEIIQKLGIQQVFSIGSGSAGLEYQIKKRLPQLHLVCSEYSSVNVAALKQVFIECDNVVYFDLNSSPYEDIVKLSHNQDPLVIINRVDIHLSNNELNQIFKKLYDAGITHVLIILCGVVTIRGIWNRMAQRFYWNKEGKRPAFAGHLRSKVSFPHFWSQYYVHTSLLCGGLPAYILEKKQ